jgi:uncharacterized protein YqgV (UPF0045/DUF77 family)
MNNFCMVIVNGRIMPLGSLIPQISHYIEHMERVLSSSQRQITLCDIEVCREVIFDIAKGSVNASLSARCHVHTSGYTGRHA